MAATTVATKDFSTHQELALFINGLANKSDDVIDIISLNGYIVLLYKST